MTSSWSGKRVVVTGGTGFIGSFLVEELLRRGAQVRIPIRAENYRSLSSLRAKIEWLDGDLRDSDYCAKLLSGVDHLFHLAANRRNVDFHIQHCSDVLSGNVLMTAALTKAMKDYCPAGVTFFSSANIPPSLDIIAVTKQESIDGYVLGKALCEALWLGASRQYGFPLLIVRPVGVYGPRDTFSLDGNVIPSLMVKARDAKDELNVWGSGRQERSFLYVEDLIGALLVLHDKAVDGIQYIVPTVQIPVKELAEMITKLLKPGLKITFDRSKPDGKRSQVAKPMHASLLTYEWTPLDEGLRRTYEWLVTRGAKV